MIGRTYFALAGRAGGMQVAGDGVKTRFGKIMIWFFAHARVPRGCISVWTKLKELEIWWRYFYVGYDVEPTCAERDFEEIKP